MGNFSISHYTGITVGEGSVELRYLIDMAEIPTFQAIQDMAIVAEPGHPSLGPFLAQQAKALAAGLTLTVNDRRLSLQSDSSTILFTPGAGGLPTMKLGFVYRASLTGVSAPGLHRLAYRDENFPDRAGWKEIIATAAPGLVLVGSSAPERDRSRQLSDYPTDLLNSPPQTLSASLAFESAAPLRAARAPGATGKSASPAASRQAEFTARAPAAGPALSLNRMDRGPATAADARLPVADARPLVLEPNRQPTPRDRFTALLGSGDVNAGMIVFAALIAAALGGFHALEPGHGKTVVAAYLVGTRGTARHAMLLGLVVTLSHTAGVYLLGGVTLYASRYVVPERLYPWLGAISGLTIAGLGLALLLRRAAGHDGAHGHDHLHATGDEHDHSHVDGDGQRHDHVHATGDEHDHSHVDGDGQRHDHVHATGDEHDHSHVDGDGPGHAHEHDHGPGHSHGHVHHDHHRGPAPGFEHPCRVREHEHSQGFIRHHHHAPAGTVSVRELLALGVTGGIVPCPAALVVLLSALALHRVGFGLFLIVAFSVGLAAVLIAIGLLVVYARRLMARVHGEGRLVTRWLPLTSSAVITVLGVAIAMQALASAGILTPGRG
jgi:ABC-type nickel/cobalt efflux system permease component RcnA